MSLLLGHEGDVHLGRSRNVGDVLAVVVAPYRLSFHFEGRNRESELVDVVGSDGFRIVAEQQRAREIQTLGRATRDLVKVVLFFKERVWRDVFERQTVLFQTVALFMRVDPIARRRQRKSAFGKSCYEHGT